MKGSKYFQYIYLTMKTTKDIVLISTPQKYNNQIEISGGTVLWLDTSFKPLHHVSISGIVEAVPGLLSPSHYAHGNSTMDLQVGDKVYFNYLTIHPDNLVWHEDKEYYQVEYFNIFCYIRDGKMHMTNSWVFVEPLEEEVSSHYGNSSIIIPQAYRKKKNYKIGRLRHIGTPQRNEPSLKVSEGDYVVYAKNADFANEIEGEVMYTMRQKDLFAVIQEECLKNFA